MRNRSRVGDVFTIPVTTDLVSYGQIAAIDGPVRYMIAFDRLAGAADTVDIAAIVAAPILFIGNFFDALIKNGRWSVIGNLPPDLDRIPFPCYRVHIDGGTYVENWEATKRRPAAEGEAARLDGRVDWGPIWLENAVKAHFGHGLRDPQYVRLSLDYVKARVCVI